MIALKYDRIEGEETVVRRRAYCKVNLYLDVIGCRTDGYHTISTIFQTINIFDTIIIRRCRRPGITVHCTIPKLSGTDNIVYRAASLFRKYYSITDGCRIRIQKNIPIGAGLGGGSSDAATTIVALSDMYGKMPESNLLEEWGTILGADVPFFFHGGTMSGTARGEVLSPVPVLHNGWIVTVNPGITILTRESYTQLKSDDFNKGHILLEQLVAGLETGDVTLIGRSMYNIFERHECRRHPVIEEIKTYLTKSGACGALMSGSGATVFGLFESRVSALRCVHKLQRLYPWVRLCRPIGSFNRH